MTEALRTETKISVPVVVLIVVLTWAVSAGFTYGVISTRVDWLMQRVEVLERSDNTYLTRTEYTESRADLAARLERIERKIDALK